MKTYWYKQLLQSSSKDVCNNNIKAVLVIAGNKHDEFEHELIKESDARNFAKVNYQYIKEIGAIFSYVSAKAGNSVDVFN